MSMHFLFLAIGFFSQAVSQDCLPSFPSTADGSPYSAHYIHGQLIIPKYSFPCRGVVKSWTFHMTGSVHNITELVFQVWRHDPARQQYHLIHPLPPLDWREGVRLEQRSSSEVVMKLVSGQSRAHVEPGDVVGVLIRGENVRLQFLNNLNIVTYVYAADQDHQALLKTDDEHYRSAAPLISAQLEINGVSFTSKIGNTPKPTTSGSANKLSTNYNSHTTTVLPDNMSSGSFPEAHPVTKEGLGIKEGLGVTSDHTASNDYTSQKLHIIYMIGVGITTCIIFLMCFCIMIILVVLGIRQVRNKNKNSVANEEQDTPKRTLSPGYSSENCSLSFLPIDSTSRLNLLAFRRQEAARNLGSAPNIVMEGHHSGRFFQTSMEEMPDSDMYVEIPPRVHIPNKQRGTLGRGSASNLSLGAYSEPWRPPLKENSSYMILHSANPPILHVYDEVHKSTSLRPCEYEVPAPSTPSCSSTQPTPVPHEDNIQTDNVIYEEI